MSGIDESHPEISACRVRLLKALRKHKELPKRDVLAVVDMGSPRRSMMVLRAFVERGNIIERNLTEGLGRPKIRYSLT